MICRSGGKLSFCNSYSGNSNSPIGGKFLSGIPGTETSLRDTMTSTAFPFAARAPLMRWIVVETPFTSSSVSVNQARRVLRNSPGRSPRSNMEASRRRSRGGVRKA